LRLKLKPGAKTANMQRDDNSKPALSSVHGSVKPAQPCRTHQLPTVIGNYLDQTRTRKPFLKSVIALLCRVTRCAVMAALMCSQLSTAFALPRGDPPAKPVASKTAPKLNPTDRTLSLLVDMRSGDRRLGEIAVKVAPDDTISIHREQFARASASLLRKPLLKRLLSFPSEDGFVALAALNAAGFRAHFDPHDMLLRFEPAINQRPRRIIRIRHSPRETVRPEAPARLSGYINIRAATDYVSASHADVTGLTAPRADLETALRWRDIVLEAEATYDGSEHIKLPGATAEITRRHGLIRRGTRLVHDRPENVVRLQAGDVIPPVTGMQRAPDLLGISVERSFRKLRPGENIRPTGKRSFRIARPSTVKVQLNGVTARQIRLDPGEYDLDDLPLRGGANEIRLIITDDVGERRTLDFTSYFDAALLAEDIYEWGLSAGVLSVFDGATLSYDYDHLIASGFYRLGLSPEVTGEAHFQLTSRTVMSGTSLYTATRFGFFGIEAALSYHDTRGPGAAIEIDWDALKTQTDTAHLRVSAELKTTEFATAGDKEPFEQYWLTLRASYGRQLTQGVHASISGRYAFASDDARHDEDADDLYSLGLGISTSLWRSLGLGVSLTYSSQAYSPNLGGDDRHESELRASLRLSWQPDRHSQVTSSVESSNPGASITASRRKQVGAAEWAATIETIYDDPAEEMAIDGALSYAGTRGTIRIAHTASLDARSLETSLEPFTDQRTSVQIGTAIAFADGHVAIGPPVGPGGFAIVHPHKNLAERTIVVGDPSHPRTRSDALGPALINNLPSYMPSRLTYDVNNLPVGYDLGTREFALRAPYKAGYALTVGSANAVTVFGTLLDREGKPVSLVTGTAEPHTGESPPVTLFTNAAGRFGAQGLSPGRWRIKMASSPVQHYLVEIPAETQGLFRAGSLTPVQPDQE